MLPPPAREFGTAPLRRPTLGVDCAAVSGSVESIFGALTAETRGFVLGATLLDLEDATAGQLTAPDADQCTAALQTLRKLPREAKAARIGQLARELGAANPAALETVHPSWLGRVLDREPSDLVTALVAGAPPSAREAAAAILAARARAGRPAESVTLLPEMATELRRLVFGGIAARVPLSSPAVAPLFQGSADQLVRDVRRLGARALGASLATAPLDVKARAAAGVGPGFADDFRDAARTADNRLRDEGETDVRMANAKGPTGAVEERLELIGISALDRKLRRESAEVRRALAVRLPWRLGHHLLSPG